MDRENLAQAFTPPPGRLGHSMPAPERVGSPLERMSFRDLHKVSTFSCAQQVTIFFYSLMRGRGRIYRMGCFAHKCLHKRMHLAALHFQLL